MAKPYAAKPYAAKLPRLRPGRGQTPNVGVQYPAMSGWTKGLAARERRPFGITLLPVGV